MGSLDSGFPIKRASPLLRPPSPSPSLSSSPRRGDRGHMSLLQRPRSKLARLLFLFEKVDYLQWICTVIAFFFVVILFQAFLPGFITEKSGVATRASPRDSWDFGGLGDLDFGEGIRFEPTKLLERFRKEREEVNSSVAALGRPRKRLAIRGPELALVVVDLSPDASQLLMVTLAVALKEIGYTIQVFAFADGPVHAIWRNIGVPVEILQINGRSQFTVDWLNYNGVLVNSLEAGMVISCLSQDPFKSLPVIWTIPERELALRLAGYASNGQMQLVTDWKQKFSRATVVVFPNYVLPMMYSSLDSGNFFVIPGSPAEAWEAKILSASRNVHELHVEKGYASEDFIIAIVGSQFFYTGSLLEHALILKAIVPLLAHFPSDDAPHSHLKVVVLSGNSTGAFNISLEAIALNLGYPKGTMEQIIIDKDESSFLGIADIVVYGSFLEEQSFPAILIKAMGLGKLVIAPDLPIIRKYVDDGVNGYLFPKENIVLLTETLFQLISSGKLSPSARNIALIGKENAANLLVSEVIEGYASLLENVLSLPSEISSPKAIADIPKHRKVNWQWILFKGVTGLKYENNDFNGYRILDKLEEQWYRTHMDNSANSTKIMDQEFSPADWAEEKLIEMENTRRRLAEEELKDRTDQPRGTWEDVYRSAKRADRAKNELHERDDRELERTGQPLCIYEPYSGEGAWPFLHNSSLYRGIGLSTKGRRPGADDIDASSRLPLLNGAYYRDVLGEYGAFFAIANRIDRIHRNAWIGFQSWRVFARKESLSKKAETLLLEAIQAQKHGDTLYFWARMDKDKRNVLQHDFWSFCESINAGNCRFAVSEALRKMYNLQHDIDPLPPMPVDGDTWSVMHSWVLPSRSFLEFVMFSRMFVNALDAQMYDEHHRSGHCILSIMKDRQCYSRVLEILVNVWAYHSARHMVYVNPETGTMQEQHKLKSRRGHMWIKWFSFTTLKSMDEDLAEEYDSDNPHHRWLWPLTGEVFCQGVYERERNMRLQEKEKRKRHSREKIRRIRSRTHQKAIGKYVKPPPEGDPNTTVTVMPQ
ncbi:hypothetical protein QJS04_geneDACA006975 [Acorus gramineus]|uniref:Glycosyl transferase family 1 domain-containing protein n=1 Tax=Acorus gramineus TaxID=55184 RepID=A0AAV9B0J2_ACOGR|nr:hypothetical protein QJS04_geneDACA006975 [Acorus gramineus]